MPASVIRALCVTVLLSTLACDVSTSRVTPEQEQRFTSEGIVRKADDLDFRFTRDPGGRSERWENRRASIVVTKSTLLIHKNAKLGLEITPRTQREAAVERTGDRIRIRVGRGRSEEVWSFVPPSDAVGWVTDIRALIKSTKGSAR
jgi:hypothetical protein